jgi:drug/metabolite transporter (DMT)-like permease
MTSHPDIAPPAGTPAQLKTKAGRMSPTRRAAFPSQRAGLVWLALATVYVVWGSTYLGIRIVTESLPAFGSAALRFTLAAAIGAAFLLVRRGPAALRLRPAQLGAVALVGATMIAGGNGFVVLAESPRFGLPSGLAALLVALGPLTLVVMRAVTGDRPRWTTVLGVLIGFAGLVILFAPGLNSTSGGKPAPFPLVGGLLVLLGTSCWSVGSFVTAWLPMPAEPFVASVYEMIAGALVLGTISVFRGEWHGFDPATVPAKAWAALAYLTLFGSLMAFTAFVWLLHHAPISLVSTNAYVNPVIALALGAAFAAETLSGRTVLSAAIVVVGVVLVVSTERRARSRPE